MDIEYQNADLWGLWGGANAPRAPPLVTGLTSDALWIVSFKCMVKGYQECRFDVKDGEVFRVLKKIGEKGRAFRIANERGQLGHLQRELVASLWPVNASITWQ